MSAGYLYVLVHPSNPNLKKIGHTTRKPEERLAEHNSNCEELTSQIVKETDQKWELKKYIEVPDPAYAEAAFWEYLCPGFLKQPKGVEVVEMVGWDWIEEALEVARKVGMRPPPKPRTTPVRNREWMIKQLEGTGITMLGRYRGLVTGVEFQCAKGHTFKKSAGVVAYGKSCPICDISRGSSPDETSAKR